MCRLIVGLFLLLVYGVHADEPYLADCVNVYSGSATHCLHLKPVIESNNPGCLQPAASSPSGSSWSSQTFVTCSNHGECIGGECQCNSGYAGQYCQLPPCPNNCSAHGLCVHDDDNKPYCLCTGLAQGEDCSLGNEDCPPGCGGVSGICRINLNGEVWCECRPGFTGDSCDIPTCKACDHGSCDQTTLECKCTDGWVGPSCSIRKCSDHDCYGHGYCVATTAPSLVPASSLSLAEQEAVASGGFIFRLQQQLRAFFSSYSTASSSSSSLASLLEPASVCKCFDGYSGDECQFTNSLCPRNCTDAAHGRCTPDGCECEAGFNGKDCSETQCVSPCINGGLCVDGMCLCPSPFTGTMCQEEICPNQCNGNGVCLSSQCSCLQGLSHDISGLVRVGDGGDRWDAGYAGDDCSQRRCMTDCGASLRPARGRCDHATGLCQCNYPFIGLNGGDCNSVRCNLDCNGGTGSIIYPPPFPTPAPDSDFDDYLGVLDGEEGQHGLCMDNACHCYPGDAKGYGGWRGEHCEIPLCPNSCGAPDFGDCWNGTCVCVPPHTGVDCMLLSCPKARDPLSSAFLQVDEEGDTDTDTDNDNNTEDDETFLSFLALVEGDSTDRKQSHSHNKQRTTQQKKKKTGHVKQRQRVLYAQIECAGHGTCAADSGLCACENGWRGPACDQRECPNDCSGHGECQLDGTCLCTEPWSTADCSIDKYALQYRISSSALSTGRGAAVSSSAPPLSSSPSSPSSSTASPQQQPQPQPFVLSSSGGGNNNMVGSSQQPQPQPSALSSSGQIQPQPIAATRSSSATSFDLNNNNNGKSGSGSGSSASSSSSQSWYDQYNANNNNNNNGASGTSGVSGASGSGSNSNSNNNANEPYTPPNHVPIDGEEPEEPGQPGQPGQPHPYPIQATAGGGASGGGGSNEQPPTSSWDDMESTGSSWAQPLPPATTLPGCPNNCSIDLDVRRGVCSKQGVCLCLRGKYHGDDCSQVYCPNDCSGRGECNSATGTCTCVEGAGGIDCSLDWCVPANCSGHGVCNTDLDGKNPFCRCQPPYAGPICTLVSCGLDCGAHGVCRDNACYCDSGWKGDRCQQEKCPNSCSRRGVCMIDQVVADGAASPEGCKCNAGYTGSDCSQAICNGQTCPNKHSACSIQQQCICQTGWSGPTCSDTLCSPPCQNGYCDKISTQSATFMCVCDDKWSGPDCSLRNTNS